DDDAVRLMNDSPYGLTASIWTRDQERALRAGSQIETGTFFMNRCDYLDPQLPWTGVKDSGKGNSLSRYGFLSVTRRKSFHLRRRREGVASDLQADVGVGSVLHENGKHAVLAPAGLRRHPLRHLALEEQDGAAHECALIEQMEEDRRGEMIGQASADDHLP